MLQSSGKRAASTPPPDVGARPTKRPERSSSPEEGELDDADPLLHASSPRLPSAPDTPPPTSRYTVKVKLPFKTKANPIALPGTGVGPSNNFKGVPAPAIADYYHVPPDRTQPDGWPFGIEAGRSKENAQATSRGWKGRNHTTELSHRDRDVRDRRRDRQPSGSSQESPVGDYGRVGRPKIRTRSRSRSSARSSSGSRSSSKKHTHRLPPHRPTRGSPSPLLSRRREGTSDSRDLHDHFNSHPHPRYNSVSHWRHDGRGPYRKDLPENYYAGEYYDSPRPSYRDYHDRGHERDPYMSKFESVRGRAPATDYRPISPQQTSLVRRSRSSSPSPTRTPPRPRSPPPPTPPQSQPELQSRHTITFLLPKKPPESVDPPSLSRPLSYSPNGEQLRGGEADVTLPEGIASKTREKSRDLQTPHQIPRPIRIHHRRTREEEYKAFGRTFVGSGQQDDYDAMTKLGEGTFGEVHKAKHHPTGKLVALKRILMHNEKEGMPVTALREIKILKALKHPNVVELLDMFVVRGNGKDKPLSVYMVFPYMDHDLAGLLENDRVKLQPSQIKLYMKQLLQGTEYMHRNHILHRDMKAANLLISNNGSLQIADFGLARSYDPSAATTDTNLASWRTKERRYTNCVVTRWYRPPELLLGARNYGGEIDIWGVGCVLGEMFLRHPILPGNSDLDQLEKIWQMCGTPNQHTWPNFDTLPGCEGVKHHNQHPKRLKSVFEQFGAETCDLIDRLLTCNPGERITATQALEHDYFWTDPLPADPKTLPVYEASHEFDKRGRRQQPPQAPHKPPRLTEPPRLPPSVIPISLPPYLNRSHPPLRPPPTRSGVPLPLGHQNPHSQPLDHRSGVPMNLPPIHYPAQGPPPAPYQIQNALIPPQSDPKSRIPNLPPRPPMPMGLNRFGDGRSRTGGRDNIQRIRGERDRNHGGLNYG